MENRLPGVWAGVHDDAPAEIGQILFVSQATGEREETPGQRAIVLTEGIEPGDVAFRNEEEMDRRRGVQVVERHELVVLEDLPCRDVPGGDAAEDAVAHGSRGGVRMRITRGDGRSPGTVAPARGRMSNPRTTAVPFGPASKPGDVARPRRSPGLV
jgi:hypothetical protein